MEAQIEKLEHGSIYHYEQKQRNGSQLIITHAAVFVPNPTLIQKLISWVKGLL